MITEEGGSIGGVLLSWRLPDPTAPEKAGAIPPKQQPQRSDGTESSRGPAVGGPQTGEGSAQDGGKGRNPEVGPLTIGAGWTQC